ncbi:hypothetical protein [Brevibacterium sp. p3-SID960]
MDHGIDEAFQPCVSGDDWEALESSRIAEGVPVRDHLGNCIGSLADL